MENKLNEKGFTLIEMLLVLAIVMTITSSVIFIATSKFVEIEEKRFIRQFQLDVQSIQSVAIAEEKYAYLNFFNGGTKYVAKSANTILFESEMPAGYRLSTESNLKEIGFHPNGSIKDFGTLIFETKKGSKKVILYIGRGRMNYE
ncbi:competence type IV pilus minor pilin ComGD [Psychrobacillus sp. NPDC058041]|uniref:competence type IV pilus minor pilin ComGD n=1 Tax=Psychrobacillus sp. NPDC058041 TaxID=3346310 RepID=UPI0036DF4E51